jgi:hypothetical protein
VASESAREHAETQNRHLLAQKQQTEAIQILVPRPKGRLNLQDAMGLADDKATYNDIRVSKACLL